MDLDAEIRSLRSQLNALKRKLARPLAQLRIERLAEEECMNWVRAEGEGEPLPEPHFFIWKVARAGFRLPTFTALSVFLNGCRKRGRVPEPKEIVHRLLPWTSPYSRLSYS